MAPAVLTDYEVGRAILAAETIARTEKHVAEVGCQKAASTVALEDDLRKCVKLAGHAGNVRVWTRATSGGRVRYGFYREEWVLDALDFLDRTDLSDVDRAGSADGYSAIDRTRSKSSSRERFAGKPDQARPHKLPRHRTLAVVAVRRFLTSFKDQRSLARRASIMPSSRHVAERSHLVTHQVRSLFAKDFCPMDDLVV